MKEAVKKAYKHWASSYDDEWNPSIGIEQDKVVRLINPKKGDRILDAGCGTGRYSHLFQKKGASVTGVDFSKHMLAVAKMKNSHVSYIMADLTKKLPVPHAFFDKVVCSLVISHLKKLHPFLSEIRRVLKKRGFAVVSTLHPDGVFSSFKLVKFNFPLSSYDCTIMHTFSALENEFKKAGLKEAKRIELSVNHSIKHCFTKKSFKLVRGMPMAAIFKLERS